MGSQEVGGMQDHQYWICPMISVIPRETKNLAEPGNGTRWAQILRPGLRMTIPTPRFPSSPQFVSGDASEWKTGWTPDNDYRE
jgi:hypothetical protein